MKPILFITVFLFAATYGFSQSVNIRPNTWSDNTSWNLQQVPDSTFDVVLDYNVVVDVNAYCRSLVTNGHTVTVNNGVTLNIVGRPASLGVRESVWGSTRHGYVSRLEANNRRLFFTASNWDTGLDDFYACNETDVVYKLQPHPDSRYQFRSYQATTCLKPNGDIIALMDMGDSIITFISRPHTTNWEVIKREYKSSFWNGFYSGANQPAFLKTTHTGRLVLTGQTQIAVSDDNGLNWRITTNLPAAFYNMNMDGSKACYVSGRDFILSANAIMYSANNFETASAVAFSSGTIFDHKIIKLADQRLVTASSNGFYQSFNNGISWSLLSFGYPTDSLSGFKNTYFCYAGGNTIRLRARYAPCSNYYTIDVKPEAPFTFYPPAWPTCPASPFTDYCIKSCQREDGRMYFIETGTIGTLTYYGITRDY